MSKLIPFPTNMLAGFIKKAAFAAGVSQVVIERASNRVRINIHTAKPGMVIGRGGAEIEKLRAQMEKMLNKQSKTFRELSPEQKVIDDEEHAIALMHQYPLLIKRPVLESEKKLLIGFSESTYNEFLL